MNKPTPGLRPVNRLRNRSNDIARVALVVPAGAEIDTDNEDVAAQLLANSAFVRTERERQGVEEAGGGSARNRSGKR